jgi:DNA-binding transcriptional regulator YdaS (Cro superfamily)
MPELILIPPDSTEGATIEIIFHGRPTTIHWKDEDTLVVDGVARPIVLTEWDADSIGIAFLGQGEDFTALRSADREKVADAITTQFAQLREAAAARRAEQIERIVAEVERQKAAELGRSLSAAERDYVRKLARAHVVGRTD